MQSPFANLGAEFANFCRAVVGDGGDATVTVERVDQQTGEATATAHGVVALKLTSTGQPVRIGGGGSVGADQCQFWLVGGGELNFSPAQNDRIVEPSDGPAWNIDLCETVGYTDTGTLHRCPVTLAREDATE
jgi:hypothetical protein